MKWENCWTKMLAIVRISKPVKMRIAYNFKLDCPVEVNLRALYCLTNLAIK
jgi:hypothetical protein